ncbi:MAG: hypothetical protein ACI35O_12110 [Bacillaceae bacterium]
MSNEIKKVTWKKKPNITVYAKALMDLYYKTNEQDEKDNKA